MRLMHYLEGLSSGAGPSPRPTSNGRRAPESRLRASRKGRGGRDRASTTYLALSAIRSSKKKRNASELLFPPFPSSVLALYPPPQPSTPPHSSALALPSSYFSPPVSLAPRSPLLFELPSPPSCIPFHSSAPVKSNNRRTGWETRSRRQIPRWPPNLPLIASFALRLCTDF
ncbi:hypothetical protein DFH07DRAFT_563618 [Mycena maculata]|uniref:Uncharacterized protein n=1 Tax=Mycena maculata TaxID=230809 RepID=A0AAD7IS52_9AGAR|nr:hypothetical protein DFH07DRAFT_563618 [Mycena maculata]